MSVAKVIEISSQSPESFEDAVRRGIEKTAKTVHNIQSAWVKEQQVRIENNAIKSYRVDLKITFIID